MRPPRDTQRGRVHQPRIPPAEFRERIGIATGPSQDLHLRRHRPSALSRVGHDPTKDRDTQHAAANRKSP